jgi:hypothetical protein
MEPMTDLTPRLATVVVVSLAEHVVMALRARSTEGPHLVDSGILDVLRIVAATGSAERRSQRGGKKLA